MMQILPRFFEKNKNLDWDNQCLKEKIIGDTISDKFIKQILNKFYPIKGVLKNGKKIENIDENPGLSPNTPRAVKKNDRILSFPIPKKTPEKIFHNLQQFVDKLNQFSRQQTPQTLQMTCFLNEKPLILEDKLKNCQMFWNKKPRSGLYYVVCIDGDFFTNTLIYHIIPYLDKLDESCWEKFRKEHNILQDDDLSELDYHNAIDFFATHTYEELHTAAAEENISWMAWMVTAISTSWQWSASLLFQLNALFFHDVDENFDDSNSFSASP